MTVQKEPITVLVVDDQSFFRARLQSQLEVEGYRVITAPDAAAGIAAAEASRPDLIILDVVMPGMDGIEACRRLKASSVSGHVPVIIFTASSHPWITEEAYRAGAELTLRKGEAPESLLRALRLALVRRGSLHRVQAGGADGAPRGGISPALPDDASRAFERRRSPRAHLLGPLEDTITAAVPLRLLNLSATGALVEHEAPLGGDFTLVLRHGPAGPALTVRCRVVHSRRVGDGAGGWKYRTGVDFASPSPAQAATLSEWVEHIRLGSGDAALAM